MHRFFIPNITTETGIVHLENLSEIHHMKNVLRLKGGRRVVLFDGKGNEWEAEILNLKNSDASVKIIGRKNCPASTNPVILACALPKKAKFDFIVEKCTELGVDEIIPMKTKRTEVILKDERAAQKIKRFEKIAINAAKQSGRKTIPVIHSVMPFSKAVTQVSKNDIGLIPCLFRKEKTLTQIKPQVKDVSQKIIFFIGPEGDFTEQEVGLAVSRGSQPVSLGENTLKVDTAALSVVSFAKLYLCL